MTEDYIMTASSGLIRIGVFYDGDFFFHVSNYYNYHHDRRARISISGLHAFIREEVSRGEDVDVRFCHIVDAHYFRTRLRASDADDRDLLRKERTFDEVLMREGVTTHYLPSARDGGKDMQVWLALEAFEQSIHKHFDVVVLIACDGDYLPLVRKVNTLGARVMVLAWDFSYVDHNGQERETRTAQALLEAITYPVMMHQIIDDHGRQNDPEITGLFVIRREPRGLDAVSVSASAPLPPGGSGPPQNGTIQNLLDGYGFITPEGSSGGSNLFFFYTDVESCDFNELRIGDSVSYVLGQNHKGPCAKRVAPV
jgi:cold shock CspA family protein/uncharacterized LabA/DUF88 family protein